MRQKRVKWNTVHPWNNMFLFFKNLIRKWRSSSPFPLDSWLLIFKIKAFGDHHEKVIKTGLHRETQSLSSVRKLKLALGASFMAFLCVVEAHVQTNNWWWFFGKTVPLQKKDKHRAEPNMRWWCNFTTKLRSQACNYKFCQFLLANKYN